MWPRWCGTNQLELLLVVDVEVLGGLLALGEGVTARR